MWWDFPIDKIPIRYLNGNKSRSKWSKNVKNECSHWKGWKSVKFVFDISNGLKIGFSFFEELPIYVYALRTLTDIQLLTRHECQTSELSFHLARTFSSFALPRAHLRWSLYRDIPWGSLGPEQKAARNRTDKSTVTSWISTHPEWKRDEALWPPPERSRPI